MNGKVWLADTLLWQKQGTARTRLPNTLANQPTTELMHGTTWTAAAYS